LALNPFFLFIPLALAALAAFLTLRQRSRRKAFEFLQAAKKYAEDGGSSPEVQDEVSEAFLKLVRSLKSRIARLEEEKVKTSAILNYMTEGVIGVDADLRIVVINPGAESILHLPSHGAKGKTLLEVTHQTQSEDLMARALETQSHHTAEIELAYPEPMTLHMDAIGLPEKTGEMAGILVFYDITALRRLENMRKEFVANVSHELRTPLTSVNGFIETLLGGALKDAERSESFLKMMREDTQRLTRLIDDLLNLSQIESHELPLERKPLSLKEEVRKAATVLQPRLDEKKLRLEIEIPDAFPPVLADGDKLKQVLLNLLDNAVKFNRPGGRVIIRAQQTGRHAEIRIQDTGIGIPPEAAERIFERFYRVDKARASETGGTGLGLSIVKHIVEAHGGKVRCDSLLGKGSTFFITLPLAS
jgi:two-component system phosphate regulon sensor histidine kinase PhoR